MQTLCTYKHEHENLPTMLWICNKLQQEVLYL